MAGQNWRKNKKGFMVNPEGKTARQVKQEKYAAKKAEAKAKASGASTDNLTWEQQKSLNALTGGKSPIFSKLSDKSKRELLKISDELEALNREADRDRVTGKGAWKRPSEASIKRSEKRSNRYRLLRNRVEALDDEKGTAKPASKGKADRVDISDGDIAKEAKWKFLRLDFENIDTAKGAKFSESEINKRADRILKQGGLASPLLVEQVGIEKYRVLGNSALDLEAAKRAYLKNPDLEAVNSIVVKKDVADLAREQFQIFGRVKTDKATRLYRSDREGVPSGFKRIDIGDISASDKQFSSKALNQGAKSILKAGGLLTPVLVKKVGFEKYELVEGHKAYQSAKLAFNRAPNSLAETINVIIVE